MRRRQIEGSPPQGARGGARRATPRVPQQARPVARLSETRRVATPLSLRRGSERVTTSQPRRRPDEKAGTPAWAGAARLSLLEGAGRQRAICTPCGRTDARDSLGRLEHHVRLICAGNAARMRELSRGRDGWREGGTRTARVVVDRVVGVLVLRARLPPRALTAGAVLLRRGLIWPPIHAAFDLRARRTASTETGVSGQL